MTESSKTSPSLLPVKSTSSEAPQESIWANAIRNMNPAWFTLSMNTGILSILTYELPWQFSGLRIISGIFYVFNIVLFATFSTGLIIRWTVFRRTAIETTAGNIDEICMLAAAPIAFLTLIGSTALIPTNASWGGDGFTILAIVMFWLGTAFVLVVCCGAFITCFRTRVFDDRSSTPTCLMPMVATATNAVMGAVVSGSAHNISAGHAVPIIVVSYMLLGIGFFGAFFLYTLYFNRLLAIGFPPGAKAPSLFMLVAPYGQVAAALTLLGHSSSSGLFAEYNKGTFLTSSSSSVEASAGVMFALMSLGMALFWLVIALWGIAEAAYRRELQYNLTWWALIFPLATITTSCLALSELMDSDAFRGLTAALVIILVVEYFGNWVFTIWYAFKGDLVIKREKRTE